MIFHSIHLFDIPTFPIDEIDINQWQSISINRLILIIDDQSITKIFVTSIGIDYYRLSSNAIDCHRLLSIITIQFLYSLNYRKPGMKFYDSVFFPKYKEITMPDSTILQIIKTALLY